MEIACLEGEDCTDSAADCKGIRLASPLTRGTEMEADFVCDRGGCDDIRGKVTDSRRTTGAALPGGEVLAGTFIFFRAELPSAFEGPTFSRSGGEEASGEDSGRSSEDEGLSIVMVIKVSTRRDSITFSSSACEFPRKIELICGTNAELEPPYDEGIALGGPEI